MKMKFFDFFSQAARERRAAIRDQRRFSFLYGRAERAVNVTYVNGGIWVTLDGVPTFRVTNDSDVNARTIAIGQVDLFIMDLRRDWVSSHSDDAAM